MGKVAMPSLSVVAFVLRFFGPLFVNCISIPRAASPFRYVTWAMTYVFTPGLKLFWLLLVEMTNGVVEKTAFSLRAVCLAAVASSVTVASITRRYRPRNRLSRGAPSRRAMLSLSTRKCARPSLRSLGSLPVPIHCSLPASLLRPKRYWTTP
uniref:Uncharacterized protein n=1 Tax=Ixodes ricinus TaxID=34613 RepID=A0A147BF09_IXORI